MDINNFLYGLLKGNSDFEFFEILGHKIYFDDLLIISLIFCLYKEGVEDQLLLIALLFLLLC